MLAVLFSIPALAIIAVFYILHLLFQARPKASFLYSGTRLGKDLKPYTMYKIRTLRKDASFEDTGNILPEGSRRELRFGKLLRDSRLDELPQLWNVIRGDMNLVGPRPMRPVVYEKVRAEISNCEFRFRVKPGMTGYAQFLTPSHAPKRIRLAIDNYYINRGNSSGRDLFLIIWTIREVVRKTITGLWFQMICRMQIVRHRGSGREERQMQRKRFKHIWIQMSDQEFSNAGSIACPADPRLCSPQTHGSPLIHIYDINPQALSFYSSRHLPLNSTMYFFLVGCKECETGKKKKARCIGTVYKQYPEKPGSGTGSRYVVFYEPLTPRHRYLVDHYVIHQTVA